MTLQSIGFKFFAKIMKGSCVFCCSSCINFKPTSYLKVKIYIYICSEYYVLNLFIEHSGEHWWEQILFARSPQAFWLSSTPGILSTLVTLVVLNSLTWATLRSPGQDETRICGYVRSEFIHRALWRTLMRTKYFLFVHHKHFGKAQHLVFWALWWHQLFSTR